MAGFRLESVADFVGIHTLMGHERRTMTLNLTYDELAERLGTTRNAARVLAQRRKWHRYTSQEDGRARVRVPEDELERLGARRGGTGAEHEPPHNVPPANGEIEALKTHIQTLRELLEQKDAAHAAELARLIEERAQLWDKLQEALAEADHAKVDQVRMARDVATMFDELKALADKHAELHADRARLQAELEKDRFHIANLQAESARLLDQLSQARSETANERAHSRSLSEQFERVHREHRTDTDRERRPWWRRLFGLFD